jgi:SAM-dependent methyltransferase
MSFLRIGLPQNQHSVAMGRPPPFEVLVGETDMQDQGQRADAWTHVMIGDMSGAETIEAYWSRAGLEGAIVDALVAMGKDLDALTVDDLAPLDQFHGGGKGATLRLARLAGLEPGTRVLDVGGGLGGPARTLAVELGCRVTVVDLTETYVRAAEMLTARLGLGSRVTHRVGDALALPFDDAAFDVVWTQNSGMNIEDKAALYAGFHRVLRPGGRLAFQEPMAGPVDPPIYPMMWAREPGASFLRRPPEMLALVEAAGFTARAWDDVTAETAGSRGGAAQPSIQRIVMGDALEAISRAGDRNREEGRLVMVQAVFDRLEARAC